MYDRHCRTSGAHLLPARYWKDGRYSSSSPSAVVFVRLFVLNVSQHNTSDVQHEKFKLKNEKFLLSYLTCYCLEVKIYFKFLLWFGQEFRSVSPWKSHRLRIAKKQYVTYVTLPIFISYLFKGFKNIFGHIYSFIRGMESCLCICNDRMYTQVKIIHWFNMRSLCFRLQSFIFAAEQDFYSPYNILGVHWRI